MNPTKSSRAIIPSLTIVTLVSFLIFITKGIDNYPNWRFYASLVGMMVFVGFSVAYYLHSRKQK